MLLLRCGPTMDYSGPVNDRALLHIDNCYHLPNLTAVGHRCRIAHAEQHRLPRLPAGRRACSPSRR